MNLNEINADCLVAATSGITQPIASSSQFILTICLATWLQANAVMCSWQCAKTRKPHERKLHDTEQQTVECIYAA